MEKNIFEGAEFGDYIMKEAYVSFEQAKDLKYLGFPKYSARYPYYDSEGNLEWIYDNFYEELDIEAPTLSLVQKWLREEKNLHLYPYAFGKFPDLKYDCWIKDYNTLDNYYIGAMFSTYEEALSKGIDKCIKLLRKQNSISMKVFVTQIRCCYGGGMIMVAANSKEEALEVASKESKYDYLFKEWEDDNFNKEIVKINEDLTDFTEVEGLSYKTIRPEVIIENIFRE